jgi:hypothetical protein
MEQRRWRHWSAAMSVTLVLAGCGAMQVSDGTGTTQPLGQWLESLKPSNVMAENERKRAQKAAPAAQAASAAEAPAAPALEGVPGRSTAEWPASQGCRVMDPYTTKLDVDTVYAKAMRAYSFRSIEQETQRRKTDALMVTETNYLHERQPGAYYHLRQTVGFKLPPEDRHSMWLELEIAKNTAGSDVSIKYCYLTPTPPVASVHLALQKRLRAELGG